MEDPLEIPKKLASAVPDEMKRALGELLRVPLDSYRADKLYKILLKANGLKTLDDSGRVILSPKVISKIAEYGSHEDDEDMQSLWAGLLASATDEESVRYVEILNSLTKLEAMIISDLCKNAIVAQTSEGLLHAESNQTIAASKLLVMARGNLHSLDQALDDLNRKELISGSFYIDVPNPKLMNIYPRALGLHFYARAMGQSDSEKFYNLDKELLADKGT